MTDQKAKRAADNFIKNETQFHLGFLETECSHPKTKNFSETVQKNTSAGVKQFLSVDYDIGTKAEVVFASEEYRMLVESIYQRVADGMKIGFSGCGSTGRLSMLLESIWRTFWKDAADKVSEQKSRFNEIAERSFSIMTGSDRALIKSVENFEDYISFGKQQNSDVGILKGDLLIAVSEGGETSSVIGTAWGALDKGCDVFFVFNNPKEILREKITRSGDLIDDPRVISLDLTTGPMALSGSTRLQATTIELLVIGAALEQTALKYIVSCVGKEKAEEAGYHPDSGVNYPEQFIKLIDSLSGDHNLKAIAGLVDEEAEIYKKGGRVTYFTDAYLLDIFADTTERSPTFSTPPFRKLRDETSPVSWAFAKDLYNDTKKSWSNMLKREPRPINWVGDDYLRMGAPREIIDNPPDLSLSEIYSYPVGDEDDRSRYEVVPNIAYLLLVADGRDNRYEAKTLKRFASLCGKFNEVKAILITPEDGNSSRIDIDNFSISPAVPDTPMYLFYHLAVKLVFNTFSTVAMACLGRIEGNWMLQVSATNKKLVDRATRIISSLADISYEKACYQLHLTLNMQKTGESEGASCVVVTLDRLASKD